LFHVKISFICSYNTVPFVSFFPLAEGNFFEAAHTTEVELRSALASCGTVSKSLDTVTQELAALWQQLSASEARVHELESLLTDSFSTQCSDWRLNWESWALSWQMLV
jgi:hypothetical protein